jgi:hypothetical protein
MKFSTVGVLVGVLAILWAVPARADVQLSMHDGRVTINATGATVREILAAWAKVGQTKIVNGERVTGGPVTLQLNDYPEEDALEIILRSVSGYMAAPRPTIVPNLSRFDRIYVMPTSTPPRTTAVPTPAPQAFTPQFNPPMQVPPPNDNLDEEPQTTPVSPQVPPPNRGPIFNTFPQPQPNMPGVQPQQNVPGMPQANPTQPTGQVTPPGRVPVGVAVPGMIVQSPQPPPQQEP